METNFEWDVEKEKSNIEKHKVDFTSASSVFKDPNVLILIDDKHGTQEERFFAVGNLSGKVLTVRFVYRAGCIRVLGAGYWRKGAKHYEKKYRS